jgi:hypothetical protein
MDLFINYNISGDLLAYRPSGCDEVDKNVKTEEKVKYVQTQVSAMQQMIHVHHPTSFPRAYRHWCELPRLC